MKSIRVRWPLSKEARSSYTQRESWAVISPRSTNHYGIEWAYGTTEEWDAKSELILVRTTDNRFVQVPVNVIEIIDASE